MGQKNEQNFKVQEYSALKRICLLKIPFTYINCKYFGTFFEVFQLAIHMTHLLDCIKLRTSRNYLQLQVYSCIQLQYKKFSQFCVKQQMNQKQTSKKHEGAATSGENPRIDKIVQMQNFYTKAITEFKVKAEYVAASRQINLSGTLQQVHSQGLKIENSQIFFENTQAKMYVYLGTFPFENPVYLKHEYCHENFIKIKYKKLSDSPKNTANSQNQSSKNNQNWPKLGQAKQGKQVRTVGEVMEVVKHWRKIQVDESGNKIRTLNEAAEIVGISKKTLEDYAYQIQFGSQFNFDFQGNRHQPIGVLRAFVRNKRKQIATINNVDNYWAMQSSNSDDELKGSR